MHVAVLVKHVPDPNGTPPLGEDYLVVRDGVEGVLDPGDEFPLETALRLVEEAGEGEVTLVSMGPDEAMTAIRRGLSMGASSAVLVSDPALRGSDSLATSKVLSAAVARGSYDLVLAGVESTDGSTGTVPITVAELLGLPAVTFARKVEVADGRLRVERQTDTGYDVLDAPMPAVVTVTAAAAEPRYPTLKGIMAAKAKPVDRLGLGDLGLAPDDVASTQRVTATHVATQRSAGEILQAGEEAAERVADLLGEAKVI